MKHPYLIGGLALGGLLFAYDTWGRSPGDKAYVGSVVRVDVKDIAISIALSGLFPTGLPAGTFLYLLVTAIEPVSGAITGRLVRVQFPDRAVQIDGPQLLLQASKKAVLPLSYGAKPVPVTVL
jgi:hypothetical protein